MQYIQLFCLTIVSIYRRVFLRADKAEEAYKMVSKMIIDKNFNDELVELQFLEYCLIDVDRDNWSRIDQVFKQIGDYRPALFRKLKQILLP